MRILTQFVLALTALFWAAAAQAEVRVTFHSFDGSVLFGRYPHTFISMEGTLDDGTPVKENYGFSAKSAGPAVLAGPVKHIVMTEKDKYVRSTNRHFTVTVDDAKYHDIRREAFRWRDAPGRRRQGSRRRAPGYARARRAYCWRRPTAPMAGAQNYARWPPA